VTTFMTAPLFEWVYPAHLIERAEISSIRYMIPAKEGTP
jgi:hypothetical protein